MTSLFFMDLSWDRCSNFYRTHECKWHAHKLGCEHHRLQGRHIYNGNSFVPFLDVKYFEIRGQGNIHIMQISQDLSSTALSTSSLFHSPHQNDVVWHMSNISMYYLRTSGAKVETFESLTALTYSNFKFFGSFFIYCPTFNYMCRIFFLL